MTSSKIIGLAEMEEDDSSKKYHPDITTVTN